ncbi:pentatricopeptide repeat-containing protein At1g08070, chloroplastic-like [Asparagus officinalis]|uniref:pentatricopeptide repeat-containing protein At1g08070, chloroplastic-like n=1 Tax=Asparagus officinalis TaxID=4686 RepID=UPI00098DF571|nr:pentatricopeptide repeat-containing protein At1g08070, chloroplastic-like [Asparagus officinalis]
MINNNAKLNFIMPSNFSSQTKPLTKLLSSPQLTTKQLQQIQTQLLIKYPSQKPPLNISNSLISAYASSSTPINSFAFFKSYTHPPNNGNSFTFQSLLKSCSKSRSIAHSTQLHCLISKLGFICCTSVQKALLKCYVVCGRLHVARFLFDEMLERDIVSYNIMISGYFELGDTLSAIELFECAPNPNRVSWTAMVTGFCNNGDSLMARRYFDEMPDKDLVSWNAMISGYVRNQQPLQALHLFVLMQMERFRPNRVSIVSVLLACASSGALDAGKWIHVYVNKNKFRLDAFLGSALIDMYTKCGAVEFGLDVFTSLKAKNTCVWNTMINGLALNGHARRALDVFDQMQLGASIRPDEITFVGILMACSHGGFLEEGRRHFYCTSKKYDVSLILEHYACMVDLLCRCGLLKEAEDIVREMPMKPDIVIWRALLGGCKIHNNVALAEKIVLEMEAHESGDYVLLSNIYALAGRWKEVEKIRKIMKNMGIEKIPGSSSIEINNMIHEFISGNKSHPRYTDICAELEELRKKMNTEGYHAEITEVLYDIDEEEKEHALGHHSEKLAIGFGLISTAPGTTLRIFKNLRVCTDCHSATKLISKICKREIIVRDRVRFHHFKDGVCSCNDFW